MSDAPDSQIPAQDCELEYWLQQAENYAEVQIPADDLRAIIARAYAAVNALPELLAVKAERDRAQRACEQMGARITAMEAALAIYETCADDCIKKAMSSDKERVVGHIMIAQNRARAALNQEPGHE